ncbi:ATP-dependent DNA ligase [Paenibacillus sp. LMG 31456]|uniref:ATP-dependent DNA ligase n=1 Tax=Paenibacillus foliorum TaxID=2654974 RepID=A0A972GRS2_9BACL|nr:RNA ligase family protein [Paenibacillus foliorum]NOU95188.1 ATP-dependent DNA ligase [Paenibacillus foliorum]
MFIAPMLLELIDEPFSDPAFVYEPKLDGHRVILSANAKETRLFTRGQIDCTRQYPELLNVPVDGDIVLDGEVCCIDPDTGESDYELVMERLQLKNKHRIGSYAIHRPVHFVVWDVLFYKGRDLRDLPLMKRRSILESRLIPNEYFHLVPQTEDTGKDLFHAVVEKSMEGIVAKRKDSLYVSRSSHDWLKIINRRYKEVDIIGYCKDELGWLIQTEENGNKRPAGIIKQGIGPAQEIAFHAISNKSVSIENDRFVYLKSGIKARVMFRGLTRHGMLRAPVWMNFV